MIVEVISDYLLTILWAIIPSFFLVLLLSLVFASLGLSIGFRKLYIYILLTIFEFGRKKIETAEKRKSEDLDDNYETSKYNVVNSIGAKIVDSNGGNNNDSEEDSKHQSLHEMEIKMNGEKKEFHLSDGINFIKLGIQSIVDDEVTKRFAAEELLSWNLLTRTNRNYHYISMRLTILWGIGCLIRYLILLPTRIIITIIGVFWLVLCTAVIGCIPDGWLKRTIYWNVSLMCFRILSRAFSGIVTYHDRYNMAKEGGITVANHTSPIDVAILACDNCYALVGQRQGGFLGVLQRALARATSHIWFERFEIKDRELVTRRLREHVEDPNKLPILIFPEGTCINNSAVMMFKKGSFEVGGKIYPVAIKYDPRFGDPFWNSSKNGYMYYLLMMMSSWAIVCHVYYLPPMIRNENESAVEFAQRVKSEIAKRGGLVDLQWDGQLKRIEVKAEWKQQQQHEYSKRIKIS
ncbi:glycerol-3-phosphate acyltransferase 4-like [Oppia nitens]|uniref:glycerol-3-phosphate acyltransferase 4-like n=1 Tax=Oppia nitens TaxID=1686743 RepID=UPI0023DC083A|nr:glycerol-3-phosphate acyltransferase 4-like [Oppia nitens]